MCNVIKTCVQIMKHYNNSGGCMDIKKSIMELNDELISLRRDFHRHPEIGFEEWRTQKKIIEYLEQLDLEVKPMGGTGVLALLLGAQEGKTILLRSDIDALPVK